MTCCCCIMYDVCLFSARVVIGFLPLFPFPFPSLVRTYSYSMDRPGKAANPAARGQLYRTQDTGHRTEEKWHFFLSVPIYLRLRIWTPREIGSAIPSRVSLLILHNQAKSGTYSRDCFRFQRRGVHTVRHAVRHRVSLEFVGSHDYVAMTFAAENPPAQGH